MNKVLSALLAILSSLLLTGVVPAQAQEGHPLVGTWQSEWGNHNFLNLVLEWDGKQITGTANPGQNATTIGAVVLDSSSWKVTITTDLKDDSGKSVHFTVSGTLENIGSPVRIIKGEWHTDTDRGSLVLQRQNGA